jgi:hypothetical protein
VLGAEKRRSPVERFPDLRVTINVAGAHRLPVSSRRSGLTRVRAFTVTADRMMAIGSHGLSAGVHDADSPLTVAAPCGIRTHFPVTAGQTSVV